MDILISIGKSLSPTDYKLILGDVVLTLAWVFTKLYIASKDEITVNGETFNPVQLQPQVNKLHKQLINDKL